MPCLSVANLGISVNLLLLFYALPLSSHVLRAANTVLNIVVEAERCKHFLLFLTLNLQNLTSLCFQQHCAFRFQELCKRRPRRSASDLAGDGSDQLLPVAAGDVVVDVHGNASYRNVVSVGVFSPSA